MKRWHVSPKSAPLGISSPGPFGLLESFTHIDVLQRLTHNLLTGIINQNIQSPKLLDMLINDFFAVVLLHQIKREGKTFLAVRFDRLDNFFGALL